MVAALDLISIDVFRTFSEDERLQFSAFLSHKVYPVEQVVLQEGADQGGMFFILSGQIQLVRGAIQLGLLQAGHHFGELSLISGRPRSASAVACSEVSVAFLSTEAYERLQSDLPNLALKFQQALISRLGTQLTHLTDSFGRLLVERSLPRSTQVTIQIGTNHVQVPTGTSARTLLPEEVNGYPVVAALAQHKIIALESPLFADGELAPLTLEHWEGERIQRHSASLLFLEVLHQVSPETRAQISLSVGGTQWIDVQSGPHPSPSEIEALLQHYIQEQRPFRHEQWSGDEAIAFFQRHHRPAPEKLLATEPQGRVSLASCGDYYVLSKGPLLPHCGFLKGLQLRELPNGFVIQTRGNCPDPDTFKAYAEIMERHDRWLKTLEIYSVGALNQACVDGRVTGLIQVAEGVHEKSIARIADQIEAVADRVKVICIAGPSSSGKTTFIRRLSNHLKINGLTPFTLSLDDYYLEHELMPVDESGERDFEALEALNLDILQADLKALLEGGKVKTARFDFKQGRSLRHGGPEIQVGDQQLLLIEGIHGLNPALLGKDISSEAVFRIFVQPMLSLAFDEQSRVNPSDLRLLRRIIRDRFGRATGAAETISRWTSVRGGEHTHIFPHVKSADVMFDTSLLYEISAIKPYAERYLLEVPTSSPAYMTAYRLYQLLQHFIPVTPELIPPQSILREFVGSGAYQYED